VDFLSSRKQTVLEKSQFTLERRAGTEPVGVQVWLNREELGKGRYV
jgi:hypothetical protein